MKRSISILAAVLVMSAAMSAAPALARPNHGVSADAVPTWLRTHPKPSPTLWDVMRATARYHSVRQVQRAGYADNVVPGCFDNAVAGGMGIHYINADLLDDTIDPLKPEAIVYEVGPNGSLRLVAVEYVVPPSATWPVDGPAPTLFGHEYTVHPTLGVWKLHAWIWRPNPSGTFSDFNPWVLPCP